MQSCSPNFFEELLFFFISNIDKSLEIETISATDYGTIAILRKCDTLKGGDIMANSVTDVSVKADREERHKDGTNIKVSVVITCYNYGKFLNDALQSVLKSDFEDYEVIVVNDGSTDSLTLKVLKDLEQSLSRNERVRFIHQENLGLAMARNNGIKLGRGEYILPLDADNKIRPDYLTKAVEILDNNPEIGVVYAYAKLFGDKENVSPVFAKIFAEKDGIWEFPFLSDLRRMLLGNLVEACSMFRKTIWEECNGYDPDMGVMGYEDWDLWLGAMEKGWKFHLIKEVLFDYRVGSNSMISECSIPENRRYLIKYICNKHKNIYIKNIGYIISEQNVSILNGDIHIANLEAITKNKDMLISDKNVHIKNLEGIIKNKDMLIRDKDTHIINLERQREENYQDWQANEKNLRAIIEDNQTHIGNFEAALRDKEPHISNLEAALRGKDTHIGNLEHQREENYRDWQAHEKNLRAIIEDNQTHIGNLEAALRDKEPHISNLEAAIREREGTLNHIYNSHGWKALLVYYKFRNRMLPIGSKRMTIVKILLILFRQPSLRSTEKIGKSIKYLRLRGPKEFYRKVKEKLGIANGIESIYSEKIEVPPKCIPYESYVKNNEIQPHIRKLLCNTSTQFRYKPLISIIMPVYNVEPRWLKAAINSVIDQIYSNWELCIADDASTSKATFEVLEKYMGNDERIKVVFRKKNGHICAASNSAAELAQGEFVAFMDNDDLLAPNALFEIVRLLQENPGYDLIYSDEDKIDENDKRYDPQFKPDWSMELFLSYNYINHFTCIRRTLFETAGRFRIGYEGAQDYDLLLRVIEKTDQIRHIAKVLYHWRAVKGSVALDARDKPIMNISALNGLKDHLKRLNIQATTYQPEFARAPGLPISQLDWSDKGPSIAIIIPTLNQQMLLQKCVESIVKRTTYRNYEIVIIDNDSNDEKTLSYLEKLVQKGIRVERIGNDGGPFSFSRINNMAVQRIDAEYILFLNNDIEVSEPKWLSRLAGYLSFPGVGVVGAKLLYPNKSIQHAGVVLGMHDGIIPDHAFINHPPGIISYYFMAEVSRNCSAVTGACLMTRRSDFIRSGGFNEEDLKVSLQDVDYCLRLNKQKLRTVYVAGAELIHHQSMSRPREDDPRELAYIRKTYIANKDPYYNINLSQTNSFAPDTGCSLFDYSEFIKSPLKVMIFTHNLYLAGAPKAMYDLAVGLKTEAAGKMTVEIISPTPGPFQSSFECAGIKCRIIDIQTQNIGAGWKTKSDYDVAIKTIQDLFASENPDVLITNTVYGFYVLHAARSQNFPVIWIISESFDHLEFQRSFSDFALPECIASFAQAYSVVFGSQGTRNYYEHLNLQHNFQVIHNSVDRMAIDQFMGKISKEEARNHLGIPPDKKMLLMVGTICERKGQETLAEAMAYLKALRDDFCCYMVGANEHIAGPYLQKVRDIVKQHNLDEVIKIIPENQELYWYYRASDIFVFTSQQECYPLATLEAMAFGLPIVTTSCCGVTEQVRSINALSFNPGDRLALSSQLNVLLNDEAQRIWMGRNSKGISEYQQTYREMIEKYKRLIFGAWIRGKYPE